MNRSKQAAMAINAFVVLLVGLALAFVPLSEAQQVPKVPRIGYVSATGDANNPGFNVEAFRQGLRHLGYVERKNILVEDRYAQAKLETIIMVTTGERSES
ncbi:MAG TPA: hypothetical protein VMO00_04815 [Methylomirabilota bacterium]|nr:hypothetical protein [Methylomirabilota bacterium]